MRTLASYASTTIVVFCIAAMVGLTIGRGAVPPVFAMVAFSVLGGRYAILRVTDSTAIVVVFAGLAGIAAVAGYGKPTPLDLISIVTTALVGEAVLAGVAVQVARGSPAGTTSPATSSPAAPAAALAPYQVGAPDPISALPDFPSAHASG